MSARSNQAIAPASDHAVHGTVRYRRWWVIGAIVVSVLGLYAIGLVWIVKHLETGVENSIQLSPAITRANDTVAPVTDDAVAGAPVGPDAADNEHGNPR